jgi:hypothetical protein
LNQKQNSKSQKSEVRVVSGNRHSFERFSKFRATSELEVIQNQLFSSYQSFLESPSFSTDFKMISTSRLILKAVSSPQLPALINKPQLEALSFSTSCERFKGSLNRKYNPKKILNVRGCVPTPQKISNQYCGKEANRKLLQQFVLNCC